MKVYKQFKSDVNRNAHSLYNIHEAESGKKSVYQKLKSENRFGNDSSTTHWTEIY